MWPQVLFFFKLFNYIISWQGQEKQQQQQNLK
jgi:hypothetical protein